MSLRTAGSVPAAAAALAAAAAASAVPPQFELKGITTFPETLAPTRFVAADVNGDGAIDLICPGRNTPGRVYILPGAGDGTFQPAIQLTVGAQTDWAELVDVDGDGTRDLVLAVRSNNGRIAVMRGLGGFSFAPPVFTPTGREPRAVVPQDSGTPGPRGVAAMPNQIPQVRVYGAPGGDLVMGEVQRMDVNPWIRGLVSPQWLGAADVDGDAAADLVMIATGSGRVNVWRGAGAADAGSPYGSERAFRAATVGNEYPGISNASIVDVDGDGDLDVATPGILINSPDALIVFRNDGSGGLSQQFSFGFSDYSLAWNVDAADLDCDGDPDVVATTALSGEIDVLENVTAPGGPPAFVAEPPLWGGTFVRHVAAVDLDGDGRRDLVAVDFVGSYVIVYRNVTPGACGGVAEGAAPGPAALAAANGAASAAAQAAVAALGPAATARIAALTAQLQARVAAAGADPAARAAALADFSPEEMPRRDGSLPASGDDDAAPPAGGLASTCGPPNGSCLEVHGTPGCYTPACCTVVCGFDPHCCETVWDQPCVDIANSECDNLYCPSAGSCTEPHFSIGCSDESCCELISRLDPFCGYAFWDAICAEEALRWCGTPACTLPPPPPGSVDEAEFCYQAVNDGCNQIGGVLMVPLACGAAFHGTCDTTSPRDTDWFSFTLAAEKRVRFTVAAEFPLRAVLVSGPCDGPLEVVEQAFTEFCQPVQIDRCLPPGQYAFMMAMGTPERNLFNGEPCDEIDPENPPPPDDPPVTPGHFGRHWQMAFECVGGCGQPGDLNGDGVVNGADLGILIGTWGPAPPGTPADLNGDGAVNGADLGILIGNWTG